MKRGVIFNTWEKWGLVLRAKAHQRWRLPIPAADASATRAELPLGTLAAGAPAIPASVVDLYLERKFDIFGCGWRSFAQTRGPQVGLIEWHADLRTDTYWPLAGPAKVSVGDGSDIKFPWELARLHHLPQLAWYYQEKRAVDPDRAAKIPAEILAIVHDFVAQNPVAQGVNWFNAMEASIRACNVLVAFGILRRAGWEAPADLAGQLGAFASSHGRFILRRLEWYREGRANHYLANLCGLVFCALALPASRETDRWLRFAAGEFLRENERQFLADGSNFEGSLFYHRLSLELQVYPWALMLGEEGKRRLPRALYDRLASTPLRERFRANFRFLRALTREDGRGVQIGDNDSGRVFKLSPRFVRRDGVFTEDDNVTVDTLSLRYGPDSAESALLEALGDTRLRAPVSEPETATEDAGTIAVGANPARGAVDHFFPLPGFDPSALSLEKYPQFGSFVWRHEGLHVAIRCGKASRDGHGGHAHFDQLHAEIWWRGKCLSEDPGSLVYTANPARRNFMRGPAAHFIPRAPSQEYSADQTEDLFRYRGLPEGTVTQIGTTEFQGSYGIGGARLYRRLEFRRDGLLIRDWAEGAEDFESRAPDCSLVSAGYGKAVDRREARE